MQNLRISTLIAPMGAVCFAAALCFAPGRVLAQPANDNFATAEVLELTNMWATVQGDTTGATAEPGEPSHAGTAPFSTVWYKWTAPASGEVTFDTTGSSFSTAMAIYRGNAINALSQVGANDGAWKGANSWYSDLLMYNQVTSGFYYNSPTEGPSLVRFNAKAGEIYYIAISGMPTVIVDEEGNMDVIYEGPLSLSWAYKSAGVFHFTSPMYESSEDETFRRVYNTNPMHASSTMRHEQHGMLVTITRSMGSSGRVVVSYELEDGATLDSTVGPAEFGVDYFLQSGSVVFNEYEMSRTILVPIMPSSPDVLEVAEGEEGKAMKREFIVRITDVQLAEGEAGDVLPPRVATQDNSASCYILDADVDPDMASNYVIVKGDDPDNPPPRVFTDSTNVVVNISRRYFRVREDEPAGLICIPIARGGTNREAITVHYGVNITGNFADTHMDNGFMLTPGADYATPNPENAGLVGLGPDYQPVYGTVTIPANEWGSHIDIPILDDNLPEMNEDLLLTIWAEKDNRKFFLGQIYQANITILFDQNDPPAGSVDIKYNPDFYQAVMAHPGADNTVYDMVMDSNDKTVIVGDFSSYNQDPRNRIARVNADGTLDASFNPGEGPNEFVNSIVHTSDGKYIIGGGFSFYNGYQRNGIARVNADGSLDTTFNPGTGADGTVWALALDASGKVYIGGDFSSFDGTTRNRLARLNDDGSLDLSFDPGQYAPDGTVNALLVMPSGQILAGGEFTFPDGGLQNLAAYLTNGAPAVAFNNTLGLGPDGPVYSLALQQGKPVIGGEFFAVNTVQRTRIARLNADGSVDATFDTRTGADDTVYSINAMSTGELYVGGVFTSFNGTHRLGFTRLYQDGTVDTTFLDTAYNQFAGLPRTYNNTVLSPKPFVWASAVASDGGVIIAGGFSQVGGGQSLPEVQPPDYPDVSYMDPYYEGHNRAGIHNRANIARLVGGATPGPGNLGLLYDKYSVNQQQTLLYVSLLRENGALGYSSANFSILPSSANGGADFVYNAIPATYRGSWSGVMSTEWGAQPYTRMMTDGYYGTNTTVFDRYGQHWPPEPWVPADPAWQLVVGIPNPGTAGSRYASFELSIPTGADHWYAGGENIPICTALGRSIAPFTIVDDNRNPGTVGFSLGSYTVSEGTNAVVTVLRTNGSAGSASVKFSTILGGSAMPNVDYYSTNGTLTFQAGQTNKSFVVRIIPNSMVQADRTIKLRLSDPSGTPKAPTLGLADSEITIVDDDFVNGYVNFASAAVITNENAGAVKLTLTRTGGTVGALKIYYRTEDGTALNGTHYLGATNYVSWADKDAAPKTIVIPFIPNDVVGGDVFFTNVLFAAVVNSTTNNAVLGPTKRTGIQIVEDDRFGTVQFSMASYNVNERGGKATLTVIRTSGSAQSISLNYSTADGTAYGSGVAPNYVPASGVLSFAPGEVAKSFDVQILPDGLTSGNIYFTVNLGETVPVGQRGTPIVALVNIIDAESFNMPAGGIDATFNPQPGFNGEVFSLALQQDGNVLVAGDFTRANSYTRNRLARLRSNGDLDASFQAGLQGANGVIRAMALQSDERIVVAGGFTQVNGVARNRIARLISDGNIDTSFNPGTGADGTVFAIAEAFSGPERTLLIGGAFNSVNGQLRTSLARLKETGALDESFNPSLALDGAVHAIAVFPTNTINAGKIMIGGSFTAVNGVSRKGIARLNADGTLDNAFDPLTGADDAVRAIAIQLDGKVVIGGAFTNFQGHVVNRLARVTVNGLLDTTFQAGEGANDTVETIRIQPDNRILLTGQFTRANGVTRNRITRLLPNGAVDPSINFEEGANSAVHALVLQPDDMMIIGGSFTQYAGVERNGVARVFGGACSGSGEFEFAAAQFEVDEAVTNAIVTIRRHGGTQGSIAVQVATTPMTAIPGVDYSDINTAVVFPEGEVLKTVTVPILHNVEVTADVMLALDITSVQGPGEYGNQPYATLTIHNTDNVVKFAAENFFRAENAVDGAATIQIVRQGGVRLGATVEFMTTTNGTAVPYLNYAPTNATIVFAPGQAATSIKVPVLRDPAAQGPTTVTMELTNGIGTMLSTPYQATLTIQDVDSAPGQFMFATTNIVASESVGAVTVLVVRTNGRMGVVTVNYATLPGTAAPGTTYQPVTGKLTFSDGETVKSFQVPVYNTTLVQGDSIFYVALTNGSAGTSILEPSIVPVTIMDDDVGVSFSLPAYSGMDKDGSVALTVLRQNGTNAVTTVQYATTNVTAMAGTNYTATAGTLTFAPGETIKTFNVPTRHDPRVTGMLSFGVNLFNPSAPAQLLQPHAAVVVIVDTDPAVGFTNFVYGTYKSATNVIITVGRTNETPDTVTVNYLTTNGTAVAGVDYYAVSGTLTFVNGTNMACFSVPILTNRVADGDKEFQVLLAGPSQGVQILPPGRATVVITNDLAGLGFSSPAYTVSENGVGIEIEVVRSGYTNSEVKVEYATENITGIAGSHYLSASGLLTFLPGETSKKFTITILDNTLLDVDHTVLLTLKNQTPNAVVPTPAAMLTIVEDDGSFVVPAGMSLASESGPVNNTVDPGETVTVWLALRNASGTNTQNLMATLLPAAGIVPTSGSQNYGALVVKGPSAFRPFSFRATGTNGQPVALTLALQDGGNAYSNAVFNISIGNGQASYTNAAQIVINQYGMATPYGSAVNVSGLGGVVSGVSLTLSNFTHIWPSDVSMVLEAPTGARSYVMSKAGGSFWVTNATLTFEDGAAATLPPAARLTTGAYKPACYSVSAPIFPSPALPAPYATNFSAFNGSNPNGAWTLYVIDTKENYAGAVSNGWTLRLNTSMPTSADVGLSMVSAQAKAIRTSNVTYTVTAVNYGPSSAANVVVTDMLPAGTAFLSAVPSQGGAVTNASGQVIWTIGSLPVNGSAQLTLSVMAQQAGMITNSAVVTSTSNDLNADDNSASAITEILEPEADLSIAIAASGNPVAVGLPMTYTVTVQNAGPAAAPGVVATYDLPAGVEFISATPAFTLTAGQVHLQLGLVPVNGTAIGTITVRPGVPATNDAFVMCESQVTDPSKEHNEAQIKTVAKPLGLAAVISGNQITISWDSSVSVTGFQSTQTLSPAVWTDEPSFAPVSSGGRSSVTLPVSGGSKFYRPKGY